MSVRWISTILYQYNIFLKIWGPYEIKLLYIPYITTENSIQIILIQWSFIFHLLCHIFILAHVKSPVFCYINLCFVSNYVHMFLPAVNSYKNITHLLTLYLTLSPLWSTFWEKVFVQDMILPESINIHVHITTHQSVTG
jgi:hypothetical protein